MQPFCGPFATLGSSLSSYFRISRKGSLSRKIERHNVGQVTRALGDFIRRDRKYLDNSSLRRQPNFQ